MEIKPTYVTFEQAKMLVKKGFQGIEIDYGLNQMLNNSRPPEQWQVIEWLRINHGIHLEVSCDVYGKLWFVKLEVCSKEVWDDLDKRHNILTANRKFINEHKSKQEAYSAAFDYILNNLI